MKAFFVVIEIGITYLRICHFIVMCAIEGIPFGVNNNPFSGIFCDDQVSL